MTRTVADFPVGLPVVVQSNFTHPQCLRPDALLPNPGGGVL